MFAYAHTGYNLSQVYAPMTWSIAFFVLGLKRGSPLFLFTAGMVAGLGVYTMMATRAVWAVMALFALTGPLLRYRLRQLWPLAIGGAVTIPFIFLDGGLTVIRVMLSEPVGGYSTDISGPILDRIWNNISINTLAFNSQHPLSSLRVRVRYLMESLLCWQPWASVCHLHGFARIVTACCSYGPQCYSYLLAYCLPFRQLRCQDCNS